MAKEYYCLISGLTDYSFSDKNRKIELAEIRAEIVAELAPKDLASLHLLYTFYDILNLVNVLKNSTLPFNTLGTLTLEEIQSEIQALEFDDEPYPSKLPAAIRLTLDKYDGRNLDEDEERIAADELENRLYSNFYKICSHDQSRFIKTWCETDRRIRNMITSHRAEALGIDPRTMIIGKYRDDKEFAYYLDVRNILETKDFIERDTKMDTLRWTIAEQITEHNYFDLSAVLSYLVKANILYRWSSLDKNIGADRFSTIVRSFTDHTKID